MVILSIFLMTSCVSLKIKSPGQKAVEAVSTKTISILEEIKELNITTEDDLINADTTLMLPYFLKNEKKVKRAIKNLQRRKTENSIFVVLLFSETLERAKTWKNDRETYLKIMHQ